MDDVEARLAGIERRLDDLERCTAPPTGQPPPHPDPAEGAERFWVLRGLEEQFPAASVVALAGRVTLAGGRRYEWQEFADAGGLVDADWSERAEPIAALGHGARLAIVRAVLTGVTTSAELGELEGFGTSGQLYHHLRVLVAAGWLRSAGRGRYEVPAGRVVPLLVVLAGCGR